MKINVNWDYYLKTLIVTIGYRDYYYLSFFFPITIDVVGECDGWVIRIKFWDDFIDWIDNRNSPY